MICPVREKEQSIPVCQLAIMCAAAKLCFLVFLLINCFLVGWLRTAHVKNDWTNLSKECIYLWDFFLCLYGVLSVIMEHKASGVLPTTNRQRRNAQWGAKPKPIALKKQKRTCSKTLVQPFMTKKKKKQVSRMLNEIKHFQLIIINQPLFGQPGNCWIFLS